MAKVTNTAEGPRGVILNDGTTHYLEPGESADLDLHEDHDLYPGVVKGSGRKAAESASDEPKPLAKMNKTELLAAAADAGVTAAADDEGKEVALDDATNKQLVAAIEKAPATK